MHPRIVTCPIYRNSLIRPDGIAIRSRDISVCYAELEARIRDCASRLGGAGIGPAGRIGILADNSIDYAILIFAAARLGATVVPINVRLHPDLWTDCIARAGCELLFGDEKRAGYLDNTGHRYHILSQGPERMFLPESHTRSGSGFRLALDDDASILFTSGSRGLPRGVILSWANHYFSALACNENMRIRRDDCWLAVLPFYHVGGMAILHRCASAGCAAYIMSEFDPEAVNHLIDSGAVTRLSLVPTMLGPLTAARKARKTPDTLRTILLGGEPLFPHLLEIVDRLSLPVMTSYGMTETASHVCATAPGDVGGKLRSSGKPLISSEIGIMDDDGNRLEDDADGEIVVRGHVVFRGYAGEKAGESRDSKGWFRTGDVGHLDGDGYLYVRGRKDDMFVSGGENIYPGDIEKAASDFDGVAECVVVPVEDLRWGTRPVLVFVRNAGAVVHAARLESYLRERLSAILMPDRIIEIADFPRNSSGKIDIHRVRDFIRDKHE